MKTTLYFDGLKDRPDRAAIEITWILQVIQSPIREEIQSDGRIRRWGQISEAGNKFLRVVLLPDGETVHNTFFDRRFRP